MGQHDEVPVARERRGHRRERPVGQLRHALESRVDPTDAERAWFEDGDFVRLREVAVSWSVPASLGRRVGARTATVSLVGRNLAMWTDYSGLDPEVSWYGQANQLQQDLFTLPLARMVSLRLDVRW